ncbi:MAG: glycosyltransferase family 2 protein [Bacteroidota bacterium]
MKPLVSVLMTAYNREKYIAEAIESVLTSTYTNFELIIVDDCSKDRTVEIAKSYEALDIRIKVYLNEQNLGDYPNRNKAASYAQGKYLKYLDSDDTMSPDCLEIMVNGMEANPGCAFGISSRSLTSMHVHEPAEAYRIHFFQRGILDISPSGSIIRNEVFKVEKGFWELRCVSDFEFWLRLALKFPMIEFQKDLIYWREHEGQEIHLGNEEYLKHSLGILSEKINQSSLSKIDIAIILEKNRKQIMRFLIKNCLKLGVTKAWRYKQMNKVKLSDAF